MPGDDWSGDYPDVIYLPQKSHPDSGEEVQCWNWYGQIGSEVAVGGSNIGGGGKWGVIKG